MSNLYKELATVYEAMYHTFIDYKDEYFFYSKILNRFNKNEVVEIGCGTGNLANYFSNAGFRYIGMDLSDEMISLAKNKASNCQFIKADMRDFKLKQPVESIIITARTISYLLTNQDINKAFSCIFKNIKNNGLLCFDFIDANQFIPIVAKEEEITHQAIANNITYIRKSLWSLHFKYGMDFKWQSLFYKKNGTELIEIGEDNSVIRAFTLNEIEIFLTINGFTIKDVIERPSYAFPTYVIVAEKNVPSNSFDSTLNLVE